VESEPDVQALLDRFHVRVDEMPVIVCDTGKVFKNPTIEALAAGLGSCGSGLCGIGRA
jgi:hypothetical protein